MSASGVAQAPRVLAVAGTDPTGGAGIHADLKSIAAHGGYGMAVVTALVAQNTCGVRALHVPPPEFLAQQLYAVSDDVVVDAVKIGMLYSRALVDVVAAWLDDVRPPVVVLDPVLGASSERRGGARLAALPDDGAVHGGGPEDGPHDDGGPDDGGPHDGAPDGAPDGGVRDLAAALDGLCSRVDLVTPNLPELAALCGQPPAPGWEPALGQARALATRTGATVLLTGGHLPGGESPDAVVDARSTVTVPGRRIAASTTHGTGCSLSSALATLAASGLGWPEALRRAKAWLSGAIEAGEALDVGRGPGPVDHFHHLRR